METITYLCLTCETRFDLPGKTSEDVHCPLCKGEATPAQVPPESDLQEKQHESGLEGAIVHRCPCGETKKELRPGNILSCVSCDILMQVQATIFYNMQKGEIE